MAGDPLVLRDDIECGVVMTSQDRRQVLDQARKIEALGFDSIWVGDHVSLEWPGGTLGVTWPGHGPVILEGDAVEVFSGAFPG